MQPIKLKVHFFSHHFPVTLTVSPATYFLNEVSYLQRIASHGHRTGRRRSYCCNWHLSRGNTSWHECRGEAQTRQEKEHSSHRQAPLKCNLTDQDGAEEKTAKNLEITSGEGPTNSFLWYFFLASLGLETFVIFLSSDDASQSSRRLFPFHDESNQDAVLVLVGRDFGLSAPCARI